MIFHNIIFFCIFDQINADFIRISDLFKKINSVIFLTAVLYIQ